MPSALPKISARAAGWRKRPKNPGNALFQTTQDTEASAPARDS
jgi:hypothetical protein